MQHPPQPPEPSPVNKFMNVELVSSRPATATQGSHYSSQKWKLPFDSLEKEPKPSELENHMLKTVTDSLPGQFADAIQHLLYSDLSPGGKLEHGEHTLTVAFTSY